MKLKKVRVTNFRCIDDSTEFTLDDVTCLVGKNEAGKSSVLKALYKLNPTDSSDKEYDKQSDYPRRYLLDYDERHPQGDADVLNTTWQLEEKEIGNLKKLLGPDSINGTEVTVRKGYANTQTWTVPIDEKKALDFVLANAELHTEEREQLKDLKSVKQLKEFLTSLGDKTSERHETLSTHLTTHFKRGTAALAAIDTLSLPKFLYFSNYDRMNGQVALEALLKKVTEKQTLTSEDRVFMSFLGLVGVSLEELAKQNQFEPLIARLEAASIKISREIFEYWTQNRHLKVQFRVDAAQSGDAPPFNSGRIMRTRILNTHHDVTVSFDERSTGFVWFFSFLVLFSQVKKAFGNNLIVLLDEPGLSLHAKAQSDLLRYFADKLQPFHQVVYTTHSPFMVPANNLLAARTVEDVIRTEKDGSVSILGTKVGDEVLSADSETLFPLQGALGYEITQTLFVGKHTLLVEGPSDLLYLKVFSEALKQAGRTYLDPRWTVCPTGGVDKVSAFMCLFGGNRLHVAMLIDFAKGQKRKVEDLRKSALMKQGHVFTANTYAQTDEGDIEDILGKEFYFELLNQTYNLKEKKMDSKKLASSKGRAVEIAEGHFREVATECAEYDHYAPSAFLCQNQAALLKDLPGAAEAMNKMEQLFKDLNKLL
ncbi:MAG: AAA family ATPase [Bdellovibrionales bacterium]